MKREGKFLNENGETMLYKIECGSCKFFQRHDRATPPGGRCHIRSVPQDFFPERVSTEWCGEHVPDFHHKAEPEERNTSER